MAVLFLFAPPSKVAARVFVATIVFLAIVLLGLLAAQISGQKMVGVIVAVSGMVTPWLFEFSRFVLETFLFIFFTVLFLFCLHNGVRREKWRSADCLLIAGSLTLLAYTYSSGRLMAPILAFGLLIFAANKQALMRIFWVWIIFGI